MLRLIELVTLQVPTLLDFSPKSKKVQSPKKSKVQKKRPMDCLDIDLLVKNHHLPDAETNRASNPSGTYTFRF